MLALGCRGAPDLPPAPAARIAVLESGIYAITAEDLAAADLGWGAVDPGALHLSARGVPQPAWVDRGDGGLRLLFFGAAPSSRYARERAYLLTRNGAGRAAPGTGTNETGPGTSASKAIGIGAVADPGGPEGRGIAQFGLDARSASDNPGDPSAPEVDRYTAVARAEQNARYEPQRADGDNWLWRALPAPATETISVAVSDPAPGPAALVVALWGGTEGPAAPDHRVRLAVNGRAVGEGAWDGRVGRVVTATVPAGVLRDGENAVTLEVPAREDVVVDIPVLDWIALRYPRFAVASADRLDVEGTGERLRMRGFSGPPIALDVTDPVRPVRVATVDGEAVLPTLPGRRYIVVGPDAIRAPARVDRAAGAPDLRAAGQGADWVAIGPADLIEPLEPLVAWHRDHGRPALAVPVEAVYDQFNLGDAEPEAIRTFLRHAARAWRPAPAHVLLVGDATYDPLGHVTPPGRNRLPALLVPTVFGGETASDVMLADLEGDARPELAIGRVPARSADQVRVFVDKTLDYLAQTEAAARPEGLAASRATDRVSATGGSAAGEHADGAPADVEQAVAGDARPPDSLAWRRTVLAVADHQEASFRADARGFVDRLARPYAGTVLTAAPGTREAASDIRARVEAGAGLVAYFGHGSLDQWGKDRIFTTDDVPALANRDRLPVVVNLTCLAGLFTHPEGDSLAEAMLFHPGGGAVAVLAPTSLTLAVDQRALGAALATAWSDGRHATLGAAALEAWRAVPVDGAGGRDVVRTFLLFGDPALAIGGR